MKKDFIIFKCPLWDLHQILRHIYINILPIVGVDLTMYSVTKLFLRTIYTECFTTAQLRYAGRSSRLPTTHTFVLLWRSCVVSMVLCLLWGRYQKITPCSNTRVYKLIGKGDMPHILCIDIHITSNRWPWLFSDISNLHKKKNSV